jgi:glycine/D-amino acid oxidase-like deaminating enzyme
MSPDDALWWQGRRPLDLPAPSGRDEYDDVVVGGGIVGFAVAGALAERGRAVAVVEAHDVVGHGTTGLSTGKLSLLQGTRLSSIRRFHGIDAAREYVDVNQRALTWLDALASEGGVVVERRRAATWAETPSQVRAARDEYLAALETGLPVTWHENPDLRVPAQAAASLADQRQVDPLELLHAIAGHAIDLGVDVHVGRRVHGVESHHHGVRVHGEGDLSLMAREAVLATGMPILDRFAAFATAQASRSYAVAFRGADVASDMLLSAGRPTHSVRDATSPAGAPVLVVGGESHVVGRGGPTTQRLDRLREWAHVQRDGLTEVGSWSAQDYMPADALPIVGRLAVGPAVHVVTGLAKWGLAAGIGYGRDLADALAAGRDVSTVPSTRLLGPRIVARLGVWNGEVGVHLAKDWLAGLGHGEIHPTVTSTVDGRSRDLSAVCTHLGGLVHWNDAEQTWDCPLHGSRFTQDGAVIEGPATHPLRPA